MFFTLSGTVVRPLSGFAKTFTSPLFPNSYGKFFEKQKFSIILVRNDTSVRTIRQAPATRRDEILPFPPDNRFRYEPKTDRMPKKISPFRSLLLCAALSLTGQAPAQPGPTPG